MCNRGYGKRRQVLSVCGQYMAMVTALNPYIGYSKAAEVAKESLVTGKSIKEIILEKNLMSEERLDELLSPISMTKPGFIQTNNKANS